MNTSSLGLMAQYSSDIPMTIEQINTLPVPAAKGSRHMPVSFGDYIGEVINGLDRAGLQVLNQEHIVGHENQRYFGLLEVGAKEGELITADDWKLLVGLRGSHDQSIQRGLCIGRQVIVCSNLCFSGNVANIGTKQTTNIWSRLPRLIKEATAKIPELAHREQQRVVQLRDYQFPVRAGDAALIELLRRNALTAAQVGRAANEWLEPTYPEHAENGFNLWRLEQAVTEAIKPTGSTSNIFTAEHRTEIASTFFNEVMNF